MQGSKQEDGNGLTGLLLYRKTWQLGGKPGRQVGGGLNAGQRGGGGGDISAAAGSTRRVKWVLRITLVRLLNGLEGLHSVLFFFFLSSFFMSVLSV